MLSERIPERIMNGRDNHMTEMTEGRFKSYEHHVCVIGDVYMDSRNLCIILYKVFEYANLAEERWQIIFLGDIIDRGPDPKGVFDLIFELRQVLQNVICLMGNHELAMVRALGIERSPGPIDWKERYLTRYDSETTFSSYGVKHGDTEGLKRVFTIRERLFFESMPWHHVCGKYLFVHAGLLRSQPYRSQRCQIENKNYLIDRPEWLCCRTPILLGPPQDCEKTIVCGHIPTTEVVFSDRQIRLDTGAGFGGQLSAVLLPERKVISVPVSI